MDTNPALQATLSLLLVLGLILLCTWAIRRYGGVNRLTGRGQRRLGIVEVAALDARRRLVLVRRDEVEHLLLLGPSHDLVIESQILDERAPPASPPAPDASRFAAHLTESTP
jgi:flagellar protein FliO/FliZ